MFGFLFNLLLRTVGIPLVAILVLGNTKEAFLAVAIVNTILTLPLAIWHAFKVLPNLALIRGKRVLQLVLEVIVEIVCMIGFWLVYVAQYNR